MPESRPEFENPPDIYYNSHEASRYHVSNRIQIIQRSMTLRALELLGMKDAVCDTQVECKPTSRAALLLDIGCGTGISGEVLTEQGHAWFGVDISCDMMRIAKRNELHSYALYAKTGIANRQESEMLFSDRAAPTDISKIESDLISSQETKEEGVTTIVGNAEQCDPPQAPLVVEVLQNDIGQGIPFRPGSFDGCISISVLQWLCHSTKKGEVPQRRLMRLFQSLYNALRRGAKAVFQFYPSDTQQIHMISRMAMKCGFAGGVVVDYPHSSKAKKYYLVLQAGQISGVFVPPSGLTHDVINESSQDHEADGIESEASEEVRDEHDHVRVDGRVPRRGKRQRSASSSQHKHRKNNRPVTGSREWVLLKKEQRRSRGLPTTVDSKYTMRRRKPRF